MKKLGYISRYDLNDTRAWSGTIHNLKNILEQEYEIVPIIVPETARHKLARKVTKLASRKKDSWSDMAHSVDKKNLQEQINSAINGGCRVFFAPAAS